MYCINKYQYTLYDSLYISVPIHFVQFMACTVCISTNTLCMIHGMYCMYQYQYTLYDSWHVLYTSVPIHFVWFMACTVYFSTSTLCMIHGMYCIYQYQYTLYDSWHVLYMSMLILITYIHEINSILDGISANISKASVYLGLMIYTNVPSYAVLSET